MQKNILFLTTLFILSFHISFSQAIIAVQASEDWVASGVIRNSNEEVIICATGEVRGWSEQSPECWRVVGPSGLGRISYTSPQAPCTTCPILSLIAKIGINGTPFYVGSRAVIQNTALGTGEIFLRINDATINDNSGAWSVVVDKDCDTLTNCFDANSGGDLTGDITVEGSSDWLPTGVVRNANEEVVFCAKGTIRAWPNTVTDCWREVTPAGLGRVDFTSSQAPCIGCPVVSLIGKIGSNGTPFYIGSRAVLQSTEIVTGEIYLKVNDATLTDNTGAWSVSIKKSCIEVESCFSDQLVSTINEPLNSRENISMSIVPNPITSGFIQLLINTKTNAEPVAVKVFDALGNLILEKNLGLTLGDNLIFAIELPEYTPNGVFLVQTNLGSTNQIQKIVLQR